MTSVPLTSTPDPRIRFRVPIRVWNRLKACDAAGIERGEAVAAALRAYLREPLPDRRLPVLRGGPLACRWQRVAVPDDLRQQVLAWPEEHRERHVVAALLRYWRMS